MGSAHDLEPVFRLLTKDPCRQLQVSNCLQPEKSEIEARELESLALIQEVIVQSKPKTRFKLGRESQ